MIQPDFEPFATPRTAEKDEELAREGWSRRFVGGPPRLRELQELYESLGHEVRLERLSAEELAQECGDCRLALELFRVVYTRRRIRPGNEVSGQLVEEVSGEPADEVSGEPGDEPAAESVESRPNRSPGTRRSR